MKTIKFEKTENADEELEIIDRFNKLFQELPEGQYELVIRKPKRTPQQNKAMHLSFEWIAEALNEHGLYMNVFFKPGAEIPWDGRNVKEKIWRRLQVAMYGKRSTTELTTTELNKIVEYLQAHIAKTHGIIINFPSIEGIQLNLPKDEL